MSEETTAKQKNTKTISIVGNKPNSKVHSITISNLTIWLAVLALCIAAGVVLGIFFFESRQVVLATEALLEQRDEYAKLQTQYDELTIRNEELSEQVQVLSDAINKRGMEDEALAKAEEESRIPRGFPVTGSVTEADAPEEDNTLSMAVYYNASETSVIVATAKGTVLSVRQNVYDNYEVQIDHGNGYVTIYTNAGYPMMEEGVEVLKGTPIFFIGEENTLVKYQVSFEGGLINAYDVMNIEG
jgi:murein DD-endopeptidase MepM/ murein hydrolase activator NlpD